MKLKKYLFKSVTSTNDIAIKKIKEGIPSGLIVAKKQHNLTNFLIFMLFLVF